jgi:uncharacterized protein YbcI
MDPASGKQDAEAGSWALQRVSYEEVVFYAKREGCSHMEKRTKGQVEAQFSEAVIKFEREYLGRGPVEARTHLLKDMIVVRLKGVFTPAEEQLAKTAEGAELIKRLRTQLLETSRATLENIVSSMTGAKVMSLHTDISTRRGERIIVFVLDRDVEATFD